jgi:ABC-type transporter Mla subunit MlaD
MLSFPPMNQFLKTIKANLFPFIVFMILVSACVFGWYFYHPSSPYHARYSFVVSYQEIGTLSPGNRVVVRGIAKGQILKVELTDAAMDAIISRGFDPNFGARPLKRYLQAHVETLIARKVIAADVAPDTVLTVDTDEHGEIVIR